jgi:hypothetical protein
LGSGEANTAVVEIALTLARSHLPSRKSRMRPYWVPLEMENP